MHEHVICNSKDIMGSAQSHPTNTHVCNKENTHLRKHETLLECKWDAMHDVLISKIQNPSQKFHNNFINIEKTKIFKKSQKVRSDAWNAWKRRIRTLTKWRKTWSRPKNPWGWSLEWEREVLGGEKAIGIERNWEKWDLNRADPIYRSLVILDRSRGVEL